MDWKQVEARWNEASGKIKAKWVRLTDEDLEIIEGRRERLEHKIQQRYGFATDHVRKEIDDWVRCQPFASGGRRSRKTKLPLSSKRRRRDGADAGVTALLLTPHRV